MLILFVLVGNAFFSIRSALRLVHIRDEVETSHKLISSLEELVSTVKDAETGRRGFFITGDKEFLLPYEEAVKALPSRKRSVEELVEGHPLQVQRYNALLQLIDKRFHVLEEAVEKQKAGRFLAADRVHQSQQGKVVMEEIRNLSQEMKGWELSQLQAGDVEITRRVNRTISTLVAVSLLSAISLAFVFYLLQRYLKEKMEAEIHLQDTNDRLHDLSQRLYQVREDEQQRIARDLHDSLGQELTCLKLDLVALHRKISAEQSQQPLAQKIVSMMQSVDILFQQLHKIVRELRPVILDDLGLVPAIEWLSEEFQKRSGLSCKFHLPSEQLSLDKERSTAIFRVYQEILTNIMRHAHASKVHVHLKQDQKNLILEVHDNGRGFNSTETLDKKSLGILGMKERMFSFGGDIVFHSLEQRGTRVTARLPLAH